MPLVIAIDFKRNSTGYLPLQTSASLVPLTVRFLPTIHWQSIQHPCCRQRQDSLKSLFARTVTVYTLGSATMRGLRGVANNWTLPHPQIPGRPRFCLPAQAPSPPSPRPPQNPPCNTGLAALRATSNVLLSFRGGQVQRSPLNKFPGETATLATSTITKLLEKHTKVRQFRHGSTGMLVTVLLQVCSRTRVRLCYCNRELHKQPMFDTIMTSFQ